MGASPLLPEYDYSHCWLDSWCGVVYALFKKLNITGFIYKFQSSTLIIPFTGISIPPTATSYWLCYFFFFHFPPHTNYIYSTNIVKGNLYDTATQQVFTNANYLKCFYKGNPETRRPLYFLSLFLLKQLFPIFIFLFKHKVIFIIFSF